MTVQLALRDMGPQPAPQLLTGLSAALEFSAARPAAQVEDVPSDRSLIVIPGIVLSLRSQRPAKWDIEVFSKKKKMVLS